MKILKLLALLIIALFAKPQTIVFGAGCFWGVEKFYDNLPGVISATSGYAGGEYENPTYQEVLRHRYNKGIKNHAEVVKVVYDDAKISTEALIKTFWELHDPTQGERQGADIGNNYRSAIYYTTEKQREIALETKARYQVLLAKAGYGKITTEIAPLREFYEAESYHQEYLKKHPYGYCPNHSTGVKFEKRSTKKSINPLGGKEILVIYVEHCPFCRQFEKDVIAGYHGAIPLRKAREEQIDGYELKTRIVGTPTIFFIENGKEIYAHTGYMDQKSFYKALAAFMLGKESEAFHVAYHKSTDSIFCKKYKKFMHTGDGVFVDKISGDILFDTRDRFDSGSGWLSFYKPVKGAVITKEDNSYGMHRTEVIAKRSGAYLGHVFHDAPGGRLCYCINASVLEFVPREKIDE